MRDVCLGWGGSNLRDNLESNLRVCFWRRNWEGWDLPFEDVGEVVRNQHIPCYICFLACMCVILVYVGEEEAVKGETELQTAGSVNHSG